MKQAKIWGNTQLLHIGNNFEIHRIEIKKGGYCSQHYHRFKYNMFYIENGSLKITIYREDLIDETILNTGESSTVSPQETHDFEALQDTIAFEVYYVDLLENDIIRHTQGGIKNN